MKISAIDIWLLVASSFAFLLPNPAWSWSQFLIQLPILERVMIHTRHGFWFLRFFVLMIILEGSSLMSLTAWHDRCVLSELFSVECVSYFFSVKKHVWCADTSTNDTHMFLEDFLNISINFINWIEIILKQ